MKKISLAIISVLLCAITVMLCPNYNSKVLAEQSLFSSFSSKSYILMDRDSKTVLYSYNADQKLPVASICKLMTTYITLNKIKNGELSLNDKLVASEYASSVEGSQAFLDAGSSYAVKDLLKSVIVASANDSAICLAEGIMGSEENFVKLMNTTAKELGMHSTIYSNATGLSNAGQYSTAFDTCLILDKISNFDTYKTDCAIWMDEFVHPSGRVTELVNTNRLIKYYEPTITGKTGFTDEAGYCLSSTASKNGLNLIAVTLSCKDSVSRFKESMALFNYGFSNYENQKVVDSNEIISNSIKVNKGKQDSISVTAEKDCFVVNKIGDKKDIVVHIELTKSINAPIKKGDIVGKIIVEKNGVVLEQINAISNTTIEKQNYKDIINKIGNNWKI